MKIQIVSQGSTPFDYWRKRWGLSILINDEILFDTFCTGELLKTGFRKLKIDVAQIKHIILSHEHWDHIGGLFYILQNTENVKLYICSQFSDEFKNKLNRFKCEIIEVAKPQKIKDNIYSTGEIPGNYNNQSLFEQSLIIRQKNTIALITGCSHPGILKVLRTIDIKSPEKLGLLLGGLHLNNKSNDEIFNTLRKLIFTYSPDIIAALHCSGKRAQYYFNKIHPGKNLKVKTGDCFIFNKSKHLWECHKKLNLLN